MIHHSSIVKFPYSAKSMDINRKTRKAEVICTFDIEVSSFFQHLKTNQCYNFYDAVATKPDAKQKDADYINDNFRKGSYPYIWQFSIGEDVYYGRFIEEFATFVKRFTRQYNMKINVYVQNLGYEFQFIKHLLRFNTKNFDAQENKTGLVARRMHKVQSIHTTDETINFIDTLVLSGTSLENIPGKFGLDIKKLTGALDYDKLRNSYTVLTDRELLYCEHDCKVLYYYIKYERYIHGRLSKIPKTQTGKTRNIVRSNYNKDDPRGHKYRKQETARTAPTAEQYIELHKAFLGGYTHANYIWANKVLEGIRSYDLKSWYPAVMLLFKFPQGKWQNLPVDDGTLDYIREHFDDYAFTMTVKLNKAHALGTNSYLSISKCDISGKVVPDNGRIQYADEIITTITEQDFLIIDENYLYEDIELIECMYCRKDWIDIEMAQTIIYLFEEKERIGCALRKDPTNVELLVQYKGVKERINALYGMSVTNYVSDIIELRDDMTWSCTIIDYDEIKRQLAELKRKETLTTPYSWGVWVTAYARRGLWEMIHRINQDIVYCDTDSIKFRNYKKWMSVINWFNERQHERLIEMCNERELDITHIKGIGTFELDSDFGQEKEYREFITLGAKKYCYRAPDGLHITVSGVSKQGVKCMQDDINNFKSGFVFGYDAGGKQVQYLDDCFDATLIDENGTRQDIVTSPGIAIYPATKKMNVGREYNTLLALNDSKEYDDDLLDFVCDAGCLLLKTM